MGHDVCAIAAIKADPVIAATSLPPNLMIVDAESARESGICRRREEYSGRGLWRMFINGDAERVRLGKPNTSGRPRNRFGN